MTLLETILDNLKRVNAKNILVYDMQERSPFYDSMILSSVDSLRQATAAISYIKEAVEEMGLKVRGVEGENSAWVLIDCYSVIVSIFTHEERERFGLEKIYMDIPNQKID